MNKNIKYVASVLLAGLTMFGCSPEEFEGADQSGKPTTDGVDVSVSVDQSTNTATFTSSHLTGAYPLWYLPANASGSETELYSTQESFTRVYALSGDKKVQFRVGNRNGFSDRVIEKTIHIDNALKDLSAIAKAIASDEGKQWRIADEEEYHFAYGSSISGTDTWTVDPNDLPDLALYDDYITLTTGTASGNFNYSGSMTYSPGDDGKCQFGGKEESDSKAAKAQTSSYTITVEGDDVILSFAADTYFPFVPSESFLQNPRFTLQSYSSDLMTLVAHDGDKYWHLVLTSTDFGGGEFGWSGFTAGSNLLAGATPTFTYWCANDSWTQISDPVQGGNADKGFTFVMPAVGSSQWQGQIHMAYSQTLSADKTYDFSVAIVSDADATINATVKPHKAGDDNAYFSANQHAISKGTNIIAFSDCAGWDGEFTLTLDFAGSPEGTTITVKNIYLTEHDDANVVPFDYSDANNVWRTEVEGVDGGYTMSYWWANSSWTQISDPTMEVKQKKSGANIYTITAPAATAAQWQAQTSFVTKVSATASDLVDFSMVIQPNVDLSGVTVKLTDAANNENYFFAPQVSLKGGVPNVVKFSDTQLPKGDAASLDLVLDFGGNPEGTVIQITDICLIKK